MSPEVIKAKRKPRARQKDIVLAALEERLSCIMRDDGNQYHFTRVDELMDELRRAISSNGKEEEE